MADAVRLNAAAIRELLTSPTGPVAQDLVRRGNRVLSLARRNAPVDTGTLRASLAMAVYRTSSGPVVRVGSNVRYAVWVHEGTGIYGPRRRRIYPRRGRFLRWPNINNRYPLTGGPRRYQGGRTRSFVYARSVAGVRGRPFLVDALQAATD